MREIYVEIRMLGNVRVPDGVDVDDHLDAIISTRNLEGFRCEIINADVVESDE